MWNGEEMKKLKVILFDIETSALEGPTWRTYDTNLIKVDKDWELLSFAYKELGKKAVSVVTRQGQKSDKQITTKLWRTLNSADVVIAHNGDRFDVRKANAKFLEHGLGPTKAKVSIDTLKIAKRHFALTSNRLNDIAKLLGVGQKVETGGYQLWEDCKQGKPSAWRLMAKYNKQDVLVLEGVYNKLLEWDDLGPKRIERLQKRLAKGAA
jgi:DNA polymerase elongation subunit (family B)